MDQMEEEGACPGAQAQPLQPGYILLQSNIVLLEKRPIREGSCVFRGTFGSKIMGNKEIAIKIVNDGKLEREEAELHHSIPQHSNLVRSIQMDAFDYRGNPSIYIAMELCEINLYEYIVTQKENEVPFDPIKYISFAKDIARGLSFLHALKKIHRNLKPSNILLTENCTIAKISNFCLSKAISGGMTACTDTEGWNSPEILRDDTHISTSTDIFFCGIIFAFMWSYGKHPYGSECHCWNYRILISKHHDFDGTLMENPTVAEDLVSHMLNRNSEKRPTADEVLGNEIFNQERETQSQYDEAAKLKIPNKFEETQNLEHVKINLEDRIFNTHLELVEHYILAKKYEEATKAREKLVKFVESQNSSPEEIKTKAEHCRESKNFIRAFVLLHTAAKLVKVRAAGMAEAIFINKIVKKMNETVLGIYKEDKSKEDIFKDYFIWCMNQFTVDEMTKRNAPTVFLKELKQRCLDLFCGFYLVPLIENKILGRNYDLAEKIREKLFQFVKLQLISIEEITTMGQTCRERLNYIRAYIFYFLAAGMAKSTMNGTEAAEVIYKQMEIIGLLVGEIMRDHKYLCNIFDHIIPSISQFTVAALQEEGKILEAGYFLMKDEEQIPMLLAILVDFTAYERRAENPTSARKFQESLLQICKLQKLFPSHLNSFGQTYVQKEWFFKAFILYVSAAELAILKLDGDGVVESFEVLFKKMMDEIEDYHCLYTDVNPIAKFIIVSMDKLRAVVTGRKDMTQGQTTLAECWCLLSIGISYGVQCNWKEAVPLLESTVKILKRYLGDKARSYKVLVFAIGNLAFALYKDDKKKRAIASCIEGRYVVNDVKDWSSDEQKKEWIIFFKENAKHFGGQSGGIGVGLKSWIGRFSLRNRSKEPQEKQERSTSTKHSFVSDD